MGALKDLWNSERGIFALALTIGATALCVLGKMPIAEWETFAEWIYGSYAVTKTVTSSVALIKAKSVSAPGSETK